MIREKLSTAGFWLALLLPALAPWVCPFPPFQDWPAHVGVVGALAHMDEPAARIHEFYEYTGWFKLNTLFYLPAWGLSPWLGPIGAANACLALSLGALAPAVWWLCRSVDADPRLALLATPVALGRHVYCGFGPNAAALPLFVFSFALYFWARRARASGARVGHGVALALVLSLLAWMHAFIYLAGAGLLALLILPDLFRAFRPAFGALLALVGSAILFVVLFRQGLGVQGGASGDALTAIWQAAVAAPRDRLGETFWAWLFASYRYQRLDDLCQIAWLVGVGGAALASWAEEGARWWTTARAALFGLALVALLMFVLLPENVGPPVNWWGARLRLPVLVALLSLPLCGRAVGRQLGPFIPGVGFIAVITVVLGLVDLAGFHRTYTSGLSAVLDAMPAGRRISAINYTPRAVNEYPGQPFGYFGNFYIARKGGVVPQDFFERRELPFHRRSNLPSPPWGLAAGFRWPQHARGFDGFLLRTDPSKGDAPFYRHKDQLALEKEVGGWRYYRVQSPP